MNEGNRSLETAVRSALEAVADPATGAGLLGAGRISGLVVRTDGRIGFALEGRGEAPEAVEALRARAERAVRAVSGVAAVTAVATDHIDAPARPGGAPPPAAPTPARPAPPSPAPRRAARSVVIVASAKGGVGKSTAAVNLAVAAARLGLRVGLLDADVFGPSIPTMMGLSGARPGARADKKLEPIPAHGVATMSIGFLVKPDAPVVWRGPMLTSAVIQLANETAWGDLDLLLIDTPPGTGEVQLTLAQRAVIDGAVIVSTPQEVALADVRRGVEMLRKTAIPILGVIENMAWFESGDGVRHHLFGEGGARRTSAEAGVRFLGEAPLLAPIREGGDAGRPAAAEPGAAAEVFQRLAAALLDALADHEGAPAPAIHFVD